MSKRKIEAALRRKAITCEVLEYDFAACPGEMVGGWDIILTPEAEDAIMDHAPEGFDQNELTPDCRNVDEALAWVARLPDCRTLNPKGGETDV